MKRDALFTVARFLLPRDDRVRFPDSAAFVTRSLQTFVGDFCPELFQSRGGRFVRVPFCVIRCPRHFIQAPLTENLDSTPMGGLSRWSVTLATARPIYAKAAYMQKQRFIMRSRSRRLAVVARAHAVPPGSRIRLD